MTLSPPHALLGLLLLIGAAAPAQAQVFKCNLNGKLLYQQAPCDTGAQGAQLDLPRTPSAVAGNPRTGTSSATSDFPRPVMRPPGSPPPQVTPTAPPPQPQQAPQTARTPLDTEADACFAWYQPLLRDPAGAYYRSAYKDGRVVSLLLYATNGFGGYVSKTASCEFLNGRLDADWSKIHAQRLGW